MSAELLLREFVRVAEAPGSVPLLRRFILDIAARGKLVPQDAADGSAADLFAEIKRRNSAIRPRAASGRNGGTLVRDTEEPFALPATWVWVSLGEVLAKLTDGTHHSPPNLDQGPYRYITAKNIKPGGVSLDSVTYVAADVHAEIYARCNPEPGDVLYVKDGATTGVVTINDLAEPFSMLSSVALLKLPVGLCNRLLVAFLRAPFFYNQMRGRMKGSALPRVTLARMAPALVPLPPLAEQHRIVAKVDELMALCDELEAAQTKREKRRDRLRATSLQNLVAADGSKENARFFLGHSRRMITKPEHVDGVRQAILDLAVVGRLVPQDTGQVLKVTRASGGPPVFPGSWRHMALADVLGEESRNGYSRRPDGALDGLPILKISAGTLRRDGVVDESEHKLISGVSTADRTQLRLRRGDLVACRFNGNRDSVGVLTLFVDELGLDPIFPDKLIRLRPDPTIVMPELLRWWSRSTLIRRRTDEYRATTVGNWGISAGNLKLVVYPIPPVAEQRRIVAKVDELMALCDEWEQSLATEQSERARLLEALLHDALVGGAVPVAV